MTTPGPGEGSAAEVRKAARDLDRDRYLAALLAPTEARDALMLVAAFHGEVARIPLSVHEPAMGEIRMQWWRDALDPASAQETTGAPVADAMRRAMAWGRLEAPEVTATIDAYDQLLYPGSLTGEGAVSAFADASQGAAFRMGAHVLGAEQSSSTLVTAAAQAYGRVQLVRALPALVARGRNPFGTAPEAALRPVIADARAALDEVRRLGPQAAATIRSAILPVALVEPYLAALERLGPRAVTEQAVISPLTRVWRIYRASAGDRF